MRTLLKRTISRVTDCSILKLNRKEASSFNHHVEWIVRHLRGTPFEIFLNRSRFHAETGLYARRRYGVQTAGCARLFLSLVQQVFELGARALEARRRHVRQVVGDRIHVLLLRLHPGRGCRE